MNEIVFVVIMDGQIEKIFNNWEAVEDYMKCYDWTKVEIHHVYED